MSGKVNVVVIGAGRIGELHLTNLLTRVRHVRVLYVAEIAPSESLRKLLAEQDDASRPALLHDYHDALRDPAVQAVLVCTQTALHATICLEAIDARKHVFCEKPVSYDLGVLERLNQEAKKKGVLVQVGFNRRFDVNFKRVQGLLQSGKIGAPHTIRITSRDPSYNLAYLRESAKSGGIFYDFTIHDFDMLRFLIGPTLRVKEVTAMGSALLEKEIADFGDIDTSVVILKLDSGCLVIIDNSRKAVYGYDQRVEVFGQAGCLMVNNVQQSSMTVLSKDAPSSDGLCWFFAERYAEAFILEMNQFVACIREKRTTTPVTLEDAHHAVLLAESAKKSLMGHSIERVVYTAEMHLEQNVNL